MGYLLYHKASSLSILINSKDCIFKKDCPIVSALILSVDDVTPINEINCSSETPDSCADAELYLSAVASSPAEVAAIFCLNF